MNKQQQIEILNCIIHIQEKIIQELLSNHVKSSDKELKSIITKINLVADLKRDIIYD